MMTGALVERRSPGRRVTHESMCWVGAAQESLLVQEPAEDAYGRDAYGRQARCLSPVASQGGGGSDDDGRAGRAPITRGAGHP